jgi:hypothetical protein
MPITRKTYNIKRKLSYHFCYHWVRTYDKALHRLVHDIFLYVHRLGYILTQHTGNWIAVRYHV